MIQPCQPNGYGFNLRCAPTWRTCNKIISVLCLVCLQVHTSMISTMIGLEITMHWSMCTPTFNGELFDYHKCNVKCWADVELIWLFIPFCSQRLFPLQEPGMNYEASSLTEEEIKVNCYELHMSMEPFINGNNKAVNNTVPQRGFCTVVAVLLASSKLPSSLCHPGMYPYIGFFFLKW